MDAEGFKLLMESLEEALAHKKNEDDKCRVVLLSNGTVLIKRDEQ